MYVGQTKITSLNILYLTGIGSLKFLAMCEQFPANCIIGIFQISYERQLETIKQSMLPCCWGDLNYMKLQQ